MQITPQGDTTIHLLNAQNWRTKTNYIKHWQGCRATRTLIPRWRACKVAWKTVWQFLKVKHTLNTQLSNLTSRNLPKSNTNLCSHKNLT